MQSRIDRRTEWVLQRLRESFDHRHALDRRPRESFEDDAFEQQLLQTARHITEGLYYFSRDVVDVDRLNSRMSLLEIRYRELATEVRHGTSTIVGELTKQLDRPTVTCRLRDDDASAGVAQLIVSGGPSLTAIERGRTEADSSLTKWLEDAMEVTILDPYLFKRERPRQEPKETDTERQNGERNYADDLLAVVGKNKRVNFIYRGNADKDDGGPVKVTQGVANRISDRLKELYLHSTFYVVEDLHDRVWMKLDGKGRWHAKVIGTSRGGIGRRPTYIIDMRPEDCGTYLEFVNSLKSRAQTSHERPIDFKKPRAKQVSNSGKEKRMSGPKNVSL